MYRTRRRRKRHNSVKHKEIIIEIRGGGYIM